MTPENRRAANEAKFREMAERAFPGKPDAYDRLMLVCAAIGPEHPQFPDLIARVIVVLSAAHSAHGDAV